MRESWTVTQTPLDIAVPSVGNGGPGELALRQDKALAKRALAYEKILYPDFAVFSKDDLETGGNPVASEDSPRAAAADKRRD